MPMGGVSDEEREKLLIAHGIPHGDGSLRQHEGDAPPNPFYILLCLPVALFCMICSFFYDIDKRNK